MIPQITIFAGTYNCNQLPATKLDLTNWISSTIDHELIDFYFFSFQELTSLDNVSKNPPPIDLSNFSIWNDGTLEFINQHRNHSKVEKFWDGRLGGTMFASYVRENFKQHIKNVQTTEVECGRSKTTIKGAICMRFEFNGASFALASAHLTADQEQDNYEARIKDFHYVSDSKFPLGIAIKDHDFICWSGDLNFRVNTDRHLIAQLSQNNKFEEILINDQLRIAQSSKRAFSGYIEPPINFPPTYKFIRGTNEFCLTEPPEKKSPAYTDRVLYRYNPNKIQVVVNEYSVGALNASDHKPVNALLSIISKS
jgi:endonuclease/exonuclease/phosphatase family metal-dependent hydrolase